MMPLYSDGDLTTIKFIKALVECSSSPRIPLNCKICFYSGLSRVRIGGGALEFTVSIAKIYFGVFVRSVNVSCLLPNLCRFLKSGLLSKFSLWLVSWCLHFGGTFFLDSVLHRHARFWIGACDIAANDVPCLFPSTVWVFG
nr:hypothetical protein [Tanacetum cinerariifolium]